MTFDNYSLREMTLKDIKLVYKWRNHPLVRKYSINTNKIPIKNHIEWTINNRYRMRLIALINGKPSGVVSLNETNFWSFYMDPKLKKNYGIARIILSMFINHCKRNKIKIIRAMCHKDNIGATKLHQNFGFECFKEGNLKQFNYYRKIL